MGEDTRGEGEKPGAGGDSDRTRSWWEQGKEG